MPNDFNVENAAKQLIWTGVILNTESSNGTFHPLRRDVEGPVPPSQDFAGFAQHKVAWTWLGSSGNPCQAVGTQRAGLPAALAGVFSGPDLHTHAMAAIACLPFPVLSVN